MDENQSVVVEPHQQRVVDELAELEVKRINLGKFIGSNPIFVTLTPLDQSLLTRQHGVMLEYEAILTARVANFK